MEIKRTAAVCIAAAMLIASSGCTAVKRYTVASDDEAYKRELYPDGYSSPFDHSEPEEEQPVSKNTKAKNKKDSKKEKSKEKNKEEKKEEKKEESEKEKNKESSKSESQNTNNKEVRREEYRAAAVTHNETTRAVQPSSSRQTSDTSRTTSSSSYVSSKIEYKETDTDSEDDDIILPTHVGSFSRHDTGYYTKRGIIHPGEDESYVTRIMGEANEEFYSEDGLEKSLMYDDCEMSFYYDKADAEFILYRVQIPYDSMYETSEIIGTETKIGTVLHTYGKPTKIIKIEDDEWISKSKQKESDDAASVQKWVYFYTLDDCSLVFISQRNTVVEMEYRFEEMQHTEGTSTNESD